MNTLDSLLLALDSLRQNKVRSGLTMLGVIMGVMAVILLVAMGEAAQTYIESEFDGLGSNLLLVTPGKQETTGMAPIIAGSFRSLTHNEARSIARRGKGIAEVAPVVIGSGSVRRNTLKRDSVIFGVTEEWSRARGLYVETGRFISRQDQDKNSPVCVLGKRVVKELFGNSTAMHQKVTLNRRTFLVVGIMEDIGVTLGINMDDIVFIPLSGSQQMFHGGEDKLFQIVIAAHSPEEVGVVTKSVREILTAAHDYTEDFTITDQAAILDTFGRVFLILRVMLAGLASVSLLVGGIGIMNIMLVSIRERTREVGIRKAVGARRRDIGMQFLAESVALSLMGGCMGIAGGFAVTLAVRILYPIFPVYCSAWSVAMAFLFSMSVGVFFGVYPALRAANVDPIEALRYE